jgi:superfamily II DNA/RNA helicase
MRGMGHQKFVIFTQFKSTLEYLTQNLTGYKVIGFHGGLTFAEKEEAIRKFFTEADILICTEAGGEGRNLQIAACLINYDLPWSPLKLEQRIGRIHRFGQTRDVHIVNFACRDTVAERVLEVLEEKIRLFENALGPSDTLLGVFESEYKFARGLMSFLSAKKTKREHNEELERSLFLAKENLRNLDRLISTEHMSFNLAAFRQVHSGEAMRRSSEELRRLITDFAALKGITVKEGSGEYQIHLEEASTKRPFVRRGTFDHDLATQRVDLEFFAFGHEFIDACAAAIIAEAEKLPVIRVYSQREGMLFFCSMTLELDKKYRRMYRIFVAHDGSTEEFPSGEVLRLLSQPVQGVNVEEQQLRRMTARAIEQLSTEMQNDIRAILAKIRPSEGYWHRRIVDSAAARRNQLEERLEIQRSKLYWYGEKYAGSVSKLAGEKRRSEQKAYERLQKSDARLKPKIVIDVKKVCVFSAVN